MVHVGVWDGVFEFVVDVFEVVLGVFWGYVVWVFVYLVFVGWFEVGDFVLLNTMVFECGFGIGGYVFVVAMLVWLLDLFLFGFGYMVKGWYILLQVMLFGVDE